MDEPWLLTGEDGADLGLEQAKLTCVDGTGEIDRDTDLTDTFADDACKVETVPHVTAVGACPTVVGRMVSDQARRNSSRQSTRAACAVSRLRVTPAGSFPASFVLCLLDGDLPVGR